MRKPLLVIAAAAMTIPISSPVAAHDDHDDDSSTIALPGGQESRPEGIAIDGDTAYVGSVANGTIFTFDLDDDDAEVFLPGGGDRTSVAGMKVDDDRLYIAGSNTGRVFVYDVDTGEELFNGPTGTPASFVNDVSVAPDGTAYFTDSFTPVLYALSPDLELSVFLDLAGTPFVYQPGFNANGIAVTSNGKWALVVQSNTGKLFRVDLATKEVVEVDLGGATLAGGDGLVLRGKRLWVVRGGAGVVTTVKMGNQFATGEVRGDTSDATFAVPTTAAIAKGDMYVVNAQFNRPTDPVLPFTVSRIDVP